MLLHGQENSHPQNWFIFYSTLHLNPYLLIIHSSYISFHVRFRHLYPNRKFHLRFFLICSIFQSNSFTLWLLTYILNGFHIYTVDGSTTQITESENNYKVFDGNSKKRRQYLLLLSYQFFMLLWMIFWWYFSPPISQQWKEIDKKHMNYLSKFPDSIIMFDRDYPSEDMFRFLNSRGILFPLRIPKTLKSCLWTGGCSVYISCFTW